MGTGVGQPARMDLIGEERGRAAQALDWLDATRAELVGLGVLLIGAAVVTGVLVWSATVHPDLVGPVDGEGAVAIGDDVESGEALARGPDGEGDDGLHDHGGSGAGAGQHGGGPDVGGRDGATADGAPAGDTGEVTVHVAGQVVDPGVVTLPAGARVTDAVAAAGGTTDEADLTRVNLARTVVDGEHVRILAEGEEEPPPLADGPTGATSATDPTAAEGDSGGPLDINRASASELQALPGIGPALARVGISYVRSGAWTSPPPQRSTPASPATSTTTTSG